MMQTMGGFGPDLDTLQSGSTLGLLIDDDGALHLYVNDVDHGVAASNLPHNCYAFVDVYGRCEQVSIMTSDAHQPDISMEYCKEKAHMEEGTYH